MVFLYRGPRVRSYRRVPWDLSFFILYGQYTDQSLDTQVDLSVDILGEQKQCGSARVRAQSSGRPYWMVWGMGGEDIFIACTDNLTGFDAAIHAVFPETEIQNCIIHQLRNSSKYVSYKDLKALMTDLKAVYAAVDEQAALDALETFA